MDNKIRNLEHRLYSGDTSTLMPLTTELVRSGRLLDACQLGRMATNAENLHKWRLHLTEVSGGTLPLCEIINVILETLHLHPILGAVGDVLVTFERATPPTPRTPDDQTFAFSFDFLSEDLQRLVPHEWLLESGLLDPRYLDSDDRDEAIGYIPPDPGCIIRHWGEGLEQAWLYIAAHRHRGIAANQLDVLYPKEPMIEVANALLHYGWVYTPEAEECEVTTSLTSANYLKKDGLEYLYPNIS